VRWGRGPHVSSWPRDTSSESTIKVLTAAGYQVGTEGDNDFVCVVLRGWSAPTFTPASFRDLVYDARVRAPICFNPVAARTVLPLQELRARPAMAGKGPDQIAQGVQAAYATGELPKMEGIGFAYMWSADQFLAPGIGAWRAGSRELQTMIGSARLRSRPRDSVRDLG
jgi:hypothetical protein